jgi:hypothetical protein
MFFFLTNKNIVLNPKTLHTQKKQYIYNSFFVLYFSFSQNKNIVMSLKHYTHKNNIITPQFLCYIFLSHNTKMLS